MIASVLPVQTASIAMPTANAAVGSANRPQAVSRHKITTLHAVGQPLLREGIAGVCATQ